MKKLPRAQIDGKLYVGGYQIGPTGIIKFTGVLDDSEFQETSENSSATEEPFSLPTKRYAQVITNENQLWTLGASHPYQWTALGGRVYTDEQMLQLPGLRVISKGVEEEVE